MKKMIIVALAAATLASPLLGAGTAQAAGDAVRKTRACSEAAP